jgi:AcrR family transcriptional regulator
MFNQRNYARTDAIPPRKYRQKARAEAARETRRRIVEATHNLHSRRGMAAVSMKEIAAEAGVSVGTVYHHFPTYSDAIKACGAFTLAKAPFPGPEIFAGAASRAEKIRVLTKALFDYYESLPAFEWARRDRHVDPAIDQFIDLEVANRKALVAAAIGAGEDDGRAARIAALLDLGVWRGFALAGINTDEAAASVAEMLAAWLDRADPISIRQT